MFRKLKKKWIVNVYFLWDRCGNCSGKTNYLAMPFIGNGFAIEDVWALFVLCGKLIHINFIEFAELNLLSHTVIDCIYLITATS